MCTWVVEETAGPWRDIMRKFSSLDDVSIALLLGF